MLEILNEKLKKKQEDVPVKKKIGIYVDEG